MKTLVFLFVLVLCRFSVAADGIVDFDKQVEVPLGTKSFDLTATFSDARIPIDILDSLTEVSNYNYQPGWQGGEISVGLNLTILSVKERKRDGQKVYLTIEVSAFEKGVGMLTFKAPPGWRATYHGNPGTELSTLIPESPVQFKAKLDIGYTLDVGFAAGIAGSGLLTNSLSRKISLNVDGLIPLYSPNLPGEGDHRSTSEDVSLLSLSLDCVGYSRGGKLSKYGLKTRMPSGGQGGEVVAYLGLLSLGYQSSKRGNGIASYTFASEVEVGNRWGDVEWTNLSSVPKSTGSTVARLGVLGEFWPRLGVVNERIGQGLCVYVRGRFWLDHADVNKKRMTRGRGFVDAELFYVLPTSDYRVFVRYEGGMLPPNLSTYTNRVFAGMGAKF